MSYDIQASYNLPNGANNSLWAFVNFNDKYYVFKIGTLNFAYQKLI